MPRAVRRVEQGVLAVVQLLCVFLVAVLIVVGFNTKPSDDTATRLDAPVPEPTLQHSVPDDGLRSFGSAAAVFNYHHPLADGQKWTGSGLDPYLPLDDRYREYTVLMTYDDNPRVRYLQIWFVGHDLTRSEAKDMARTELPPDARAVPPNSGSRTTGCGIDELYSSTTIAASFGDVLIRVEYQYNGSIYSNGKVNVVNIGLTPAQHPCSEVLMPPGQGDDRFAAAR